MKRSHRFVEFGSKPAFLGIWELAATPDRRDELYNVLKQYAKLYAQNLELPGPYLTVRSTNDFDDDKNMPIKTKTGDITVKFPKSESLHNCYNIPVHYL
jgi:hypothetical protein